MNLKGTNQFNKKYNVFIILGAISIFLLGNIVARFGFIIGPNFKDYYKVVKFVDGYSKYSGLFEARNVIINNYNGDVDDEVLLDGAIKGMAASLKDPYTTYMNEDEYKKFNMSNSGVRIGIGVAITVEDDYVTISDIEEGKPAERAGLKVGDIITKVDGEDINGESSKAVTLISNTSKNSTILTILRDNETFDVEIEKEEIKSDSVESEMISSDIGYIRLKNFNEDSSTEFIDALTELKNNGMKGLIFDLRSNGGGFLTEAENIASQFIPKDKVITTLNNKFNKEKTSLSKGGIAEDIPVVLLVNKNTASASEVVTGALRDYGIATIVGTNTYGKGVAQSTYKIRSTDGALKLTIDSFYTPNGENINKVGIKPDYEVELTEEDIKGGYSREVDPQYKKALDIINEKLK